MTDIISLRTLDGMTDHPDPQQPPAPSRPPEPVTVEIPAEGMVRELLTVDQGAQQTPRDAAARVAHPSGPIARPFGDYELLGEIQRGGMGIVYHARERHSGRLVALKMMLDETIYGEADLRRFTLEARATAELQHPGIVAIHHWGVHDGHPFYTMDFVSGVPLSRSLQDGAIALGRAVRCMIGIARAVAAAHSQGIVHRDLKPSNIMIDAADQPRVLDFGLAKRRRSEVRGQKSEVRSQKSEVRSQISEVRIEEFGGKTSVTQRGAIMGTPAYMAPEQARGEHEQVSPATDVHALGAIFYEMLTGRPAFDGGSTMEILMQVADEQPKSLRQHDARIPSGLVAVCERCLEKQPSERFADAGVLVEELERWWNSSTQSRRYARLALGAGAMVLLLHGVPFLILGMTGLSQGWLFRSAGDLGIAGGQATREASQLLAGMGGLAVFQLLPALSWLAFVGWLGAWAWHSSRGLVLGLASAGLSGGAWLAWLLVGGSALFPLLLSAAALTALLVPFLRRWGSEGRIRQGRAASDGAPYLQRLFAVRGELATRAMSPAAKAPARMADVAPGKTLLHGSRCLIRWGRQHSLDRPVLIWIDTQAQGPAPGVLVRHPFVLTLHAVGACPEGYFLMTEPAAAQPLAELLERRQLSSEEALALAIRIAHALQAFHDQGASHSRLSAEWILVRGDFEPLLCPCGIPGKGSDERKDDLRDLARLLHEWLPTSRSSRQRQSLAVVYRVCEAAQLGRYERAADFADDLESAARIALARRHERAMNWTAAVLYFLGAAIGGFALIAHHTALEGFKDGLPTLGDHLLLFFIPGVALYGYSHARAVIHRLHNPLHIGVRSPWLGRRTYQALLILAAMAVVPAALACFTPTSIPDRAANGWTVALGLTLSAGYWGLGVLFAGMRTFAEVLFGSLRHLRPGESTEPLARGERDSTGTPFAA